MDGEKWKIWWDLEEKSRLENEKKQHTDLQSQFRSSYYPFFLPILAVVAKKRKNVE